MIECIKMLRPSLPPFVSPYAFKKIIGALYYGHELAVSRQNLQNVQSSRSATSPEKNMRRSS